ncbi:MAG: hypothetical protein IKO78_02720 [Bacilli bacterium]|nr:hypothetical protein [Bacilli bacterium]
MYLLKKINDNDDFTFSKILESGYSIEEQPNTISKIQFINGNRKRVYTTYEDCRIRVELGGLDETDTINYLSNLTDGEYEYWSIEHNEYRNANFIITKPTLVAGKVLSTNNYYLEDFTVLLEKSSDVE